MTSAAAILALLVALSVKVLVLVGFSAAAAWGLRRASAGCRHVLWSAVLAGVLVLALTALLRPVWSLGIGLPAAMLPEVEIGDSRPDSSERANPPVPSPDLAVEPLAHERWREV